MSHVISSLELAGFRKVASGKVREIFELDGALLFVATDRISAFDCIIPTAIPHKGRVLTQLSHFWFELLGDTVENHLLGLDPVAFAPALAPFKALLEGRSMVVKKLEMVQVECVVRGYLAGSGWKEYQETGEICGIHLPRGLRLAERLPEPIFTPAIKASSGHDENISFARMAELVGLELAEELRRLTLAIYAKASAHALQRGIMIADTKFEFGLLDGRIVLADEVLTPDSSRYWPVATHCVGENPPSYDKQFVRDYLSSLDWDKTPPAPALPAQVVEGTTVRYLECFEVLTGRPLLPAE